MEWNLSEAVDREASQGPSSECMGDDVLEVIYVFVLVCFLSGKTGAVPLENFVELGCLQVDEVFALIISKSNLLQSIAIKILTFFPTISKINHHTMLREDDLIDTVAPVSRSTSRIPPRVPCRLDF